MHQGAVARQEGAHDLLVGLRDAKFVVPENEQQQSQEVPRIDEARVGGDGRREIRRTQDEDAMMLDVFVHAGQLAVAALGGSDVDHDRARLHRFHHVAGQENRRTLAGHLGRGDHDVGGGEAGLEDGALLFEELLGDFFGIAAAAFSRGHLRQVDEPSAERLDLFLHRRPHIGDLDRCPQPLGGGERHETGDSGAEHDDARRLDRSRRRHEQGKDLAEPLRAHQHRLVAGDRGLGREDVDRLTAGGSRNELHGERRHLA